MTRYAVVRTDQPDGMLPVVNRYLPTNYTAEAWSDGILITGEDDAGWTLDDYVIPRLASGLIFAREVETPSDVG